MKLIKLSAAVLFITLFAACNTDRPYKVIDIHEGTPTNADTVVYNLHHEGPHAEAGHGEGHEQAGHGDEDNVQAQLPRVFWR